MALTYGFFHAHRQEEVVDGNTVVTYDREYNADDLNKHLEGLVAGTGVFMQSNLNASNSSIACQVFVVSNVPVYVDVPDDLTDTEVQRWDIGIKPGSGMIKHHWFKFDDTYHVYLPINSGTTDKWYKIGIILDQNDRRIYVQATDCGNRDSIDPIGGKIKSPNTKGYEPGVENGVTEIIPGYIQVSPGVAAGNIKAWNLRSTWKCPWISHLVLPDGSKSAEDFVNQYTDELIEWIDTIREGGGMNTTLDIVRVNYGPNRKQYKRMDITYEIYTTQHITYRPSPLDTILVYYNGLYMIPDVDYTIETVRKTSGDYSDPPGDHCYITVNIGTDYISVNDVLSIVIIKGQTVDIPNGNNIKY